MRKSSSERAGLGLACLALAHSLIAGGSCGGDQPIRGKTGEGGHDGSPGTGGAERDSGIVDTSAGGGGRAGTGGADAAADRGGREAAMERPLHADLPSGACRSNADCAADWYCYFENSHCSKSDYACRNHIASLYCDSDTNPGACRPRPAACNSNRRTECGCDGMTYQNPCLLAKAGSSLAIEDMQCP